MSKRFLAHAGAVVILVSFGAVMASACTLRIGRGTGTDDTQTAPDDMPPADMPPEPAGDGAGGSVEFTPEEQEVIELARRTDPLQLAIANAKAGYAAYALSGLTEAQLPDPEAVDEETLRRLIEENAPLAWELAEQWIASIDPTTLSSGYPINVTCMDPPFRCQSSVRCPFAKLCVLNDCGDGKCRGCPDTWGLGNLITSGWCTYVCYIGEDNDVVGAAIMFRPRIGSSIVPWVQLCFPNQ